MVTFNQSDPSNLEPVMGESWPQAYYFFQSWFQGICGQSFATVDFKSCCFASLDLTKSFYQSTSHSYYTEKDAFIRPTVANGATYCQIDSLNPNSLYGYNQVSTLVGMCYEGLNCTSLLLYIHPNRDCLNYTSIETFSMPTNSFKSYNSLNVGSFSLKATKYIDGGAKVSWIAYQPLEILVTGTKSTLDRMAIFTMVLTFAILIHACMFILYRYYRNGTLIGFLNGTGLVVWLIQFSFEPGFLFILFSDVRQLAIYAQFEFALKNLASLYTVLKTAYLIMRIRDFSLIAQHLTYIALTLIHVGLAGMNYLYFWYYDLTSVALFTPIYNQWKPFSDYWLAFTIIFEMIPLVYTLRHMLVARKIDVESEVIFI